MEMRVNDQAPLPATEQSALRNTPTLDLSRQGGLGHGGTVCESPSPQGGWVRGGDQAHKKDGCPQNEALPDRLVVFDGACVLCSHFARFILHFDREKRFRFATTQSPLGEALFREHGLRTDAYETNLVLIDGRPNLKFDSFLAICAALGWPWRAACVLRVVPEPLRDWLYDRVANNRHALFGRKESCDVPSRELRERLLG
jgi:predicted DCC family thiol-disulfide oxidoreductase YuxK